MAKRRKVSSGTTWETLAGYSRAIQIGSTVHVSGTTATNENGELVGSEDPYEQTIYIIRKIEKALLELGASLNDVVRTRIYVVNKPDWEPAARAHGEFFSEIRPANTLVVVRDLVGEGYLVEMEAEAVLGNGDEV